MIPDNIHLPLMKGYCNTEIQGDGRERRGVERKEEESRAEQSRAVKQVHTHRDENRNKNL